MKKVKKREIEVRKKAAIYTRVSSRGQEEDCCSFDVQLKRMEAYATKSHLVAVFQDVDRGRSPDCNRT